MAKKEKLLRITQVRSRIGHNPKTKAVLSALGLRHLNATIELPDRPEIRGMIKKIEFMLNVEDVG